MNVTDPGIAELHDLDINATRSLSAEELEKLWTDDAVKIEVGKPTLVGKGDIMKAIRKELLGLKKANAKAKSNYTPHFQTFVSQDGWAFETGYIEDRLEFPGGDPQELRIRAKVVRVLRRQSDAKWKIAWLRYEQLSPSEVPRDKSK